MEIIKYFKKILEKCNFQRWQRIPFIYDDLTDIPDKAYTLFTEKELERIYKDRNEFYKKLMQMICLMTRLV